MSEPWYPANHTYEGTPDGRPVNPHYATMPDYIQVWDAAVRTNGWDSWQKKLWRKARNQGVQRWGYPVQTTELTNPLEYRPEGITVRSFIPDPLYGAHSYGGFGLKPIIHPETSDYDQDTWSMGKGFALIHPNEVNNAFASRVTGRLTGVICHEVGHALGFGHGGLGIMESAVNPPYYPTGEELMALQAYWGLA